VAATEAGSLPLGAQKRLEIARALASEPRLLLLDEPAGGLNPTETQTLMAVVRRLRDESGLTIVVVEHDMELVMGISDRVSGLVRPTRGHILYEGRDITHVPADATVAAGVSHVPEGREIFPEFTVRENLLVGGHTVERSRIDERLESVFGLFPVLRDRQAQ